MAVVKLSRDLIHHITQKAKEPFNAQYLKAGTVSQDDSIALYRLLLVTEDQEEKLDALPSNWVRLNRRNEPIYLRHFKKDSAGNPQETQHWLSLNIGESVYTEWEWNARPYSSDSSSRDIEEGNSSWFRADLKKLEITQKYISELEKITAERDTFLNNLSQIIKSCQTLNRAAKVWPGILKYVPQEYLERLERKVERKTASSIGMSETDLQQLNVQHIKFQMVK